MPETAPGIPHAAARAAVKVAASLGVACTEPVVLADGANVIVHLSPSPVVAKVAASTPAVRPDAGAWLQRELDVALFLARAPPWPGRCGTDPVMTGTLPQRSGWRAGSSPERG